MLNKLWRLLRSGRDKLIEEVKQAAREEARRLVIELLNEKEKLWKKG
ncbi:MAG: hypothetical protein M3R04_01025 [bacterium]|nr:hypothetical protein [bacterium]